MPLPKPPISGMPSAPAIPAAPPVPAPPDVGALSSAAKTTADGWARDDGAARGKGAAPEQAAARQRVARQFREIHFPDESADVRNQQLSAVNYALPVSVINGRSVDMQNPRAKGLLGFGTKPAYWVSQRLPPQKPEDPIYALEYYPL